MTVGYCQHYHQWRRTPGLHVFVVSFVTTILILGGHIASKGGGVGAIRALPHAISHASMASLEVNSGGSRPLPKAASAEPQRSDAKHIGEKFEPVAILPKAEERPAAASAAPVAPAPLLLHGDLSPSQKEMPSNRETRCLIQDWVMKHKQLQDDMLSGENPKRFLVVRPDCGYCGMCNILDAITGTYLLAVLTDRALVIDWRYPGKRGWQEGTNYLDPRLVDWKAQSAVGADTFDWSGNKTLLLHGWNDGATIKDLLKIPEVFSDTLDVEENEAIILVHMGQSPATSLRINPEAKKRAVAKGLLAEDTVWDEHWDQQFKGCALRVLFQPSKILKDFYCQVQGEGSSEGIGVHVRTGDDRTWNEKYAYPTDEHYRFARCAEGMRQAMLEDDFKAMVGAVASEGGRRVNVERWHVASDYQQVVDDIRARFPEQVASMDTFESEEMKQAGAIRVHYSNTPYQQFALGPLMDLIKLSSGLAVIGTCRSTYSAAAGSFGMLPNELTLLKRTNFEMRYFHSTACPEMPKEDEAEGMCRELLESNRKLVEEVLRTPPFITCPLFGESGDADDGGGGGKNDDLRSRINR